LVCLFNGEVEGMIILSPLVDLQPIKDISSVLSNWSVFQQGYTLVFHTAAEDLISQAESRTSSRMRG
jgi:hypothetical protein